MSDDYLHRFLFDELDICGAVVRLGPAWRQMTERRAYPAPVIRLLGEISAVTVLFGGQLKQPGRLTLQLRGNGPVSLLLVDCDEQLRLRGMARCATPLVGETPPELLGDGQLLLSLDLPSLRQPYQSIVPLAGESLAEIFEHHLEKSEQLASRLFLAASPECAAGLLLQKLPAAETRDADGWARCTALAATLQAAELPSLPAEQLLRCLFPEETIRLFPARPVAYHCPENWEKVRSMLRALGRSEVYAALREQGELVIQDEICQREYRFDASAIDRLFAGPATDLPPTVH